MSFKYKMIFLSKKESIKAIKKYFQKDCPEDILESFQRYSIVKSEMPLRYTINITLYLGMGDFQTYYGHHSNKIRAIELALVQYINNNEWFPGNGYDYYSDYIIDSEIKGENK